MRECRTRIHRTSARTERSGLPPVARRQSAGPDEGVVDSAAAPDEGRAEAEAGTEAGPFRVALSVNPFTRPAPRTPTERASPPAERAGPLEHLDRRPDGPRAPRLRHTDGARMRGRPPRHRRRRARAVRPAGVPGRICLSLGTHRDGGLCDVDQRHSELPGNAGRTGADPPRSGELGSGVGLVRAFATGLRRYS
jgi:hypothetical protein